MSLDIINQQLYVPWSALLSCHACLIIVLPGAKNYKYCQIAITKKSETTEVMGSKPVTGVWENGRFDIEAGFTPVRRRPSTLNSRALYGDSEKDWTTTRCNRLLRVLTSRVEILKKDIYQLQNGIATARTKTADPKPTKKKEKLTDDAEWNINWKPGKRAKTYSGRGRGRGRPATSSNQHAPLVTGPTQFIPGNISVATPVLNRSRGTCQGSRLPPEFENNDSTLEDVLDISDNLKKRGRPKDGDSQISEAMRGLKKTTPASRYNAYDGILKGTEALLKATVPPEPQVKQRGARSLMTICLRNVPHYIADEKAVLDAELQETGSKSAIRNRDVSTEVYEDLESLGTSEHGWRHLRVVVRAHGIHVLSDAISEGLLSIEFCGALIKLCILMNARSEAEKLLSSLLSFRAFARPKSVFTRFCDDFTTRPLEILRVLADERNSAYIQYRELSRITELELFPLSWLATKEFSPIWSRAFQDISSDPGTSAPWLFMEGMLSKLAMLPELGEVETVLSESLKQTFSSLLTTLVSIAIIGQETVSQLYPRTTDHGYQKVIAMLQNCLISWELSHTANTGALLLLATLLTNYAGDRSSASDSDIVHLLTKRIRQCKRKSPAVGLKDELVTFVCSVARCCGRGTYSSGFEHLQQLHLLLESNADHRKLSRGNILQEIIVDSAFTFAQQDSERDHLDYATCLETRFHAVKASKDLGSTPGSSNGFRWEEGISEWVTRTPAPRCPPRALFRRRVLTTLAGDLPSSGHREGTPLVSPSPARDVGSNDDYDNDVPIPSSPLARNSSSGITTPANSGDELEKSFDETPGLTQDSIISEASDASMVYSTRSFSVLRAPRLSKRVLRSSSQWVLFDESDDELSFCSTSSVRVELPQRNLSDLQRESRLSKRQKIMVKESSFMDDVSEDELGI